jgi:hypothetical protein
MKYGVFVQYVIAFCWVVPAKQIEKSHMHSFSFEILW